jgi:phosphatidylinositol 4-kinase B
MTQSSLLRLAESQHWTVHTALEYLAIYADNIGITYYIVRRLRELPLDDVSDIWGVIWCA